MRGVLALGLLFSQACLGSGAAHAAARHCEHALSYIVMPRQGHEPWDWRVFDPTTRRDTLFLRLRQAPGRARWDTTLAHVTYEMGDSIYRADWKLGAVPRPILCLPKLPGRCDWWFNPDSLRWQLLECFERVSGGDTLIRRSRLWQCSRDGHLWRSIAADSSAELDEEGAESEWPLAMAPFARHEATVTEEDLSRNQLPEALPGVGHEVDPPPGEKPFDVGPWWFIPSQGSTKRGIVLPVAFDIATFAGRPIYLVDLDRHAYRVIYGKAHDTDRGMLPVTAQEQCGFLAVTDYVTLTVFDIETGTRLIECPIEDAVWVQPPR